MNIKNEIMDFISTKECSGALLITGEWGCGKSFLVKSVSNELNSGDKYAVAIISLFGISTTSELNRRVKEEYLELSSSILGKITQKTTKIIGSITKDGATVASAVLPESSVVAALSQGVASIVSFDALSIVKVKNTIGTKNVKQFVIVFDDFERSDIPVVQLFGAINDYTENHKIKTIIIANEEEIKEDKCSAIKEETKGNKYSDIKEKLISRTLKLTSDYPKIIKAIINSYNESFEGYRTFLINHQTCIIEVFMDSQAENIRTLKAFIIDFERVYNAWKKSGITLEKADGVLYTFGAVMFEYKKNNLKKHDKYGHIFSMTEIKNKYINFNDSCNFSTLQDWITKGIWDEGTFIKEIQQRFNTKYLSPDKKILLFSLWDLDKEIIEFGLPVALKHAYSGDLMSDELIHLLQNIQAMDDYHIQPSCTIDFDKMLSGFIKREERIKNGELEEPTKRTFIMDDVIKRMNPTAQLLYNKIEQLVDKIDVWKNRTNIVLYLNGQGSITRYDLRYHSLICFDEELMTLFFDKFQKVGNNMKREIFLMVKDLCFDDKRVSNLEDMKTTILNFKCLKEKMEDFRGSCDDPITRVIIEESIKLFPEIIDSLQKNIEL